MALTAPPPRQNQNIIQHIWQLLEQVKDPEIPVISIIDLGITRQVRLADGIIEISITPTYSGCPAMHEIESAIHALLTANGYPEVRVQTLLAPAWTTDWISASGRRKLADYGIAPPQPVTDDPAGAVPLKFHVRCPRCHSLQTRQLSEFAATACKALYQCASCLEPFDYFKPL